MIQERERLWLTHKKRLQFDFCPLCFDPIKWIFDGIVWIPCDREPILAYAGVGAKTVIYKRELLKNFYLYSDGFLGNTQPVWCHNPHIFNCTELKPKNNKHILKEN